MLRRDYIMKLIQQMMDTLFLLLNKKDIEEGERKSQLEKFYKNYTGETQSFYHNSSLEDIQIFIEEMYGKEEFIYRMEMLSEIMYQDAMLENSSDAKKMKQLKTLSILNFLENHSNTYSITRTGKIEELKKLIPMG